MVARALLSSRGYAASPFSSISATISAESLVKISKKSSRSSSCSPLFCLVDPRTCDRGIMRTPQPQSSSSEPRAITSEAERSRSSTLASMDIVTIKRPFGEKSMLGVLSESGALPRRVGPTRLESRDFSSSSSSSC